MARRKDGAPVPLPRGADQCPSLLSPGLPSAGRPRRASGPSKCRGARGSWGSGQLWASARLRRGCPFASADAVMCSPLDGESCFSSRHVGWTAATSLLVWEALRETRKSQHAHRSGDSGKEPCQACAAVSQLNSGICVHPSCQLFRALLPISEGIEATKLGLWDLASLFPLCVLCGAVEIRKLNLKCGNISV